MSTQSTQDALVYVMVTMAAAEGEMSDAELTQIGRMVHDLPVFKDYSEENIMGVARNCSALLADEEGLQSVLKIASESIPDRLYDTAYALAVEVAAADLVVRQEELRFLQMLRDEFGLDKLTVAAIERSAMARFRAY